MNLHQISWIDHPSTPVITPPFFTSIIADPFILTPSNTPDRNWHLFAHSLIGLHHYISPDGITWQLQLKPIRLLALRPYIYYENKTYYLLYEKITNLLHYPYYDSQLEICSSTNLFNWTPSRILLKPNLGWHKTQNKKGNIGNPCLYKHKNKYFLYYHAGLTYYSDCGFCEPKYAGVATSDTILGPYHYTSSILTFAPNRIIQYRNKLYGTETHFFINPQGANAAQITIAIYNNATGWNSSKPVCIYPESAWKKSHCYVGHIVEHNSQLILYYNARNKPRNGVEKIGRAVIISKPIALP